MVSRSINICVALATKGELVKRDITGGIDGDKRRKGRAAVSRTCATRQSTSRCLLVELAALKHFQREWRLLLKYMFSMKYYPKK